MLSDPTKFWVWKANEEHCTVSEYSYSYNIKHLPEVTGRTVTQEVGKEGRAWKERKNTNNENKENANL